MVFRDGSLIFVGTSLNIPDTHRKHERATRPQQPRQDLPNSIARNRSRNDEIAIKDSNRNRQNLSSNPRSFLPAVHVEYPDLKLQESVVINKARLDAVFAVIEISLKLNQESTIKAQGNIKGNPCSFDVKAHKLQCNAQFNNEIGSNISLAAKPARNLETVEVSVGIGSDTDWSFTATLGTSVASKELYYEGTSSFKVVETNTLEGNISWSVEIRIRFRDLAFAPVPVPVPLATPARRFLTAAESVWYSFKTAVTTPEAEKLPLAVASVGLGAVLMTTLKTVVNRAVTVAMLPWILADWVMKESGYYNQYGEPHFNNEA